jgi:hypothetical protein
MSNFNRTLFVDRERKYRGFQKLLQPSTRQAIMIIEAPKDMGKTWVIGKMRLHCQEPDVNLPVAQIDFRNPRQLHEIQDFLGLVRLLRDELDAPDHFQDLNATISQFTAVVSHGGQETTIRPELVTVWRLLEQYFNLEDLATLCFQLSINFENLAGSTLSSKARELVSYCEQRQLMPQLLALCRENRPHVDWSLPAAGANEGAVTVSDRENDGGAPLLVQSDVERRHAERQISQAFFEGLTRLVEEQGTAVFLFDSFEMAPQEAERWLLKQLLLRLRDGAIPRIVVVIAGRKTPDITDLQIDHLVVKTGLSAFNETYIREYFEQRRNINDLDFHTITLTSGGVPGILAMMAEHALLTQQEDDDFFSDL